MIREFSACESVTLDLHDVKTVGEGIVILTYRSADPVVGGEAA
jgi:hypothetical protein